MWEVSWLAISRETSALMADFNFDTAHATARPLMSTKEQWGVIYGEGDCAYIYCLNIMLETFESSVVENSTQKKTRMMTILGSQKKRLDALFVHVVVYGLQICRLLFAEKYWCRYGIYSIANSINILTLIIRFMHIGCVFMTLLSINSIFSDFPFALAIISSWFACK